MDNVARMEGERWFFETLTEAIEQRQRQMESTELPALKDQFRVFHASLRSLTSVLLRKGLIQEDPYKNEQKISDIVMSEDTEFPETERDVIVGARLSELDNVLEYANSYCEFSIASLDFVEIKKLGELARYIAWDALAINSSKPATRGLAVVLGRLQQRMDSLAAGILNSALGQLRDRSLEIVDRLKRVRAFAREQYKLEIRRQVLPRVADRAALIPGDPAALKAVRAAFTESALPVPFIPELITEVLEEDSGSNAAERRRETLHRLRVSEGPKGAKTAGVPLKETLVDAIRALAASSRSLEAALERLRENDTLLRSRKKGLVERLWEWFSRVVNRTPARHVYSLEFLDETTGTRHREEVDLDEFLELLQKKSRVYAALLSRSGSVWSKIEQASNEQLYQFLNQELGSVHLIHRRADAFAGYFKAQATRDEKRRLRGIKTELTTIRNGIAKANQLKHDYVSRRDEKEHLQKIGIRTE